jgi:dTDP-4-amino-4,6-dideoxygalactose transaminase
MGLKSNNKFGVKVAVHYGGEKYQGECDIEDSAHRIEPNDYLIGKIRCYSFYATKNMTTGSGGMLVTNDKDIYERCRLYWRDGITKSTLDRMAGNVFYKVEVMSGGYDGNDIAAAIGREQLRKLPSFNARRNEIVSKYNKAFGQDWTGNHLYPYFVSKEEEVKPFIEYMQKNGVSVGYHYPGTGWLGISLPLYPLLTDEEVDYIIEVINGRS